MSNAVPAHTGRSLAYVGRATVLGRPTPFKDIGIPNVNDTYKGQVLTTDGKTAQAIIKDLPLRELANEVMAAALGAALKLDIPAACIGYVTDEELVATKSPRVPGGALVFVSLDVSTPSFAHVVNGHRGGAAVLTLLKALISRGQIGRCYGFDSWAANTDRHIGNLLFDGNGRPWLIDHGWCFTGPQWKVADLDPALVYRNRLKEWLTPYLSEPERESGLKVAQQLIGTMANIDIRSIGEANMVRQLLGESDFGSLVEFLHKRLQHATRLAADALEIGLVA